MSNWPIVQLWDPRNGKHWYCSMKDRVSNTSITWLVLDLTDNFTVHKKKNSPGISWLSHPYDLIKKLQWSVQLFGIETVMLKHQINFCLMEPNMDFVVVGFSKMSLLLCLCQSEEKFLFWFCCLHSHGHLRVQRDYSIVKSHMWAELEKKSLRCLPEKNCWNI